MANLPEKNITTVDKITSIPSNTNLYINANGEFRQATVDDVLKASPVIADSIANQYKNASGSPILLTDSAKGVAIDFEVKGRSTQAQYSGKNKLDCSGLSATTTNGVTFTPYYDDNGSLLYVNVNGTATATASFVLNSNMLFDVESYILNGCPSGGSSSTYKLDVLDTKGSILVVDSGNGVSFDVASAFTSQGVRIVVYGGVTANNLKFYPMLRLASVTDSTYEPYVGGTASPNPTYPQDIKSVGDMGYFDGELLQGYYSTSSNGTFVSNPNAVSSKNPIPCNGGDSVKLKYNGDNVTNTRILFFDESGTYISGSLVESAEITLVAPTNASYCHFTVYTSNAITPQTAKHICVTINDKYALIVDSVGKNSYKIDKEYSSATQNGISLTTDVEKGTVTVNGTATADFGNYLSIESSNRIIRKGSYVLSSNVVGSSTTYGLGFGYKPIGGGGTNYKWVYDTEVTVEFTTDVIVFPLIQVKSGVTVNNLTFYPMIRPLGTDATYEPYKESVKYIPISAPLRGIGEVTDVANLSECKVDRKFSKVTYDGNSDISMGSSLKYFYSPKISNAKPSSIKLISTHYKNNGGINVNYGNIYIDKLSRIIFADNRFSTASEVKEWLSANPITVIYELAEPTTESIEPTDVDTFEGVTHISVSDNADMEVEYPTSKVAGVASIGWSKGRRAEYDLEQLKAQMLALQTTIISTV